MEDLKIKVENEYVSLEMSGGILIATYKVQSITLDIAIEVVHFRKNFMNNKKHHALIKDARKVNIEKKARDYFSSSQGSEGILSVAILTKSIYTSALMNFFLKVVPPKMPVKLFKSEKKALDWLKEKKKFSE